ncbi:leucine-rich_repeat domain-containing protein [Hexamita inflata]|uniref:Leucine-rich repeat domain-containing protein n=1 Tax=Hexamita inflata TaxID=28002 RepID=A0AA86VTZ6_9EUKA|nr:leucine-rich repeat domain-containing protein [Hexamita inflata]
MLDLSKNKLQSISPIYNNDKLVELNVSDNNLQNLDKHKLAKHGQNIFQGLTKLILSKNELESILDLQYIKNLTYIDLSTNKICNIQPLQSLTALIYLNVAENKIQNIWPLKHMSKLKELNISSNLVVDIQVLRYLTCIKKFFFKQNNVVDISVLRNLHLEEVSLYNNYILKLISEVVRCVRPKNETHQFKPLAKELLWTTKIKHIFNANNLHRDLHQHISKAKSIYQKTKLNAQKIVNNGIQNQILFTNKLVNLFSQLITDEINEQ